MTKVDEGKALVAVADDVGNGRLAFRASEEEALLASALLTRSTTLHELIQDKEVIHFANCYENQTFAKGINVV